MAPAGDQVSHPATRTIFRCKTWRGARAGSALRVDEALDQLGREMIPNWGTQPGFDELPLFWPKDRAKLIGIRPKGTRGFERVDIDNVAQLAPVADDFEKVYRELRKGMGSKVPWLALDKNGERRKWPGKDLLVMQRISVFGAGQARLKDGKFHLIWVNKAPFRKWLVERLPATALSTAAAERVLAVLERFHEETGATFVRPDIKQLVNTWRVDRRLSEDSLEELWSQLPEEAQRKGGRFSAKSWELSKAALLSRLGPPPVVPAKIAVGATE